MKKESSMADETSKQPDFNEFQNMPEMDSAEAFETEPIQKSMGFDIPEMDTETFGKSKVKSDSNSEKHYNQSGFYCAIGAKQNPHSNFREQLKKIQGIGLSKIKQEDKLFRETERRFENKISQTEKKLKTENENLQRHHNDVVRLREERDKIVSELDELAKQIHDAYKKLAEAKKNLIDGRLKERLDEINAEISQLINNYQLLSKKKSEINKQIYNENKNALDKKVNRFEALKKTIEENYRIIRKKIEIVNAANLTETVFTFLIYVGLISVNAAGWFFSIFVSETKLGNDNFLTFLLRKIFTFGSIFCSGEDKVFSFFLLLIGLFGILALITFLTWMSERLIKKRGDTSGFSSEFLLDFSDNFEKNYFVRIYSKSLYTFWLQIVPYIFAGGLLLIIFSSFGTNEQEITKLMTSLSGQLIGVTITLLISGMILFYINRVIEPRFLKYAGKKYPEERETAKEKNNEMPETTIEQKISNKLLFKNNWELVFTIMLFLSTIAILIIFDDLSKRTMALSAFLVIALFTGFTLGYGLKYKGIFLTARHLEGQLTNLSYAIENNSRPKSLDLKSIENQIFKRQFEELNKQFFKLIAIRNHLVFELLSDNIKKPGLLTSKLKQLFIKDKKLLFENRSLSNIEKIYLPEHTQIIHDFNTEWSRKEIELDEIKKKIILIEERKSELEDKILNEIKTLEIRIDNYKIALAQHNKLFYKKIADIHFITEKNERNLQNGFDLGLWYRERNETRFPNLLLEKHLLGDDDE